MGDTDETKNTKAHSEQSGDGSSGLSYSTDKLDSSSSKGSEDRLLRLIQLFEKLLLEGDDESQHRPRDFSNPEWTSSLMEAAKAADSMLRKVESGDYDVHAYQLFDEGAQFSAEKIAERFDEVGWEKFSSKNTVRTFLQELEVEMGNYADNVAERTPRLRNAKANRAFQRIVSSCQPLLDDASISKAFPNFRDLLDELLNRLVTRYQGLTDNEATEWTFKHIAFMNWCFPIEEKKTKVFRKYRPYELFRYAELRGWYREKLTMTVSVLASGFVPNPTREPKTSFRVFESDAPDYL